MIIQCHSVTLGDHAAGEEFTGKDLLMAGRILAFPSSTNFNIGHGTREFSPILTTTTGHKTPSNLATDVEPPGMDLAAKASAVGLGCVRGATLMLSFEAGAAAVIFAVWLILHQIR